MAYRRLCNVVLLVLAPALAACEDDMESMLDASADAGEADAAEADAAEADAAEADAGPDDAGGADAPIETQVLELGFEARVGSAVFDCAQTYDQLGTSKVSVSMSDFRFFIHDVRLIDESDAEVPLALTQDGKFQSEDVALLDFENRTGSCVNGTTDTHGVVKGTLPKGKFKGLRFRVGVPFALNHENPNELSSPLNLTAMLWPWTQGHLFTRIDARVETGSGNRPSFLIHLGSDGCSGNPAAGQTVSCARPNRAEIELSPFDPEQDKVVLDYAKLVDAVALDQDQGGESGCMASVNDPECLSLFGKLGLDPQTGMPGTNAQDVFGAEPK